MMMDMIRSLFAHQGWADATLLKAIQESGSATGDAELRATLHHIVVAQRAFLSIFQQKTFDRQAESVPPESFAALVQLFLKTHNEEREYIASLSETDLSRAVPMPWISGLQATLAELLLQVVMHSQSHRGQCLTAIRKLGQKPPTLDFILWVKDRPDPPPLQGFERAA